MSDTPFLSEPRPAMERYDTHVVNAWVDQNEFISRPPENGELPAFSRAREVLPDPFWSEHQTTMDCYWRAWELAFGNLRAPTPENNFAANYCDTAFNGNLFMWDSCFITGFGGYGRRAFDFQKTLDTFYRKQHPDGFISREISEADGQDTFPRFDPASTGPNVLAWAEWNTYLKTGDWRRLERVFAPLVAFHQWLRIYRSWPDGSYWSSGWGMGMDNLPRTQGRDHVLWGHGHMTWVDATLQSILSAKVLLQMAELLGRQNEVADLRVEYESLAAYCNQRLWNPALSFYCDRFATGELSPMKHIGAYWALLAGCTPQYRIGDFVAHLDNPAEFNRPHRVPALSADDPSYSGTGDYWCGGVWANTNFMVLKGLDENGRGDLAHQIALNHLGNVVQVFASDDTVWTGAEHFRRFFRMSELHYDDKHTLWENYAPDVIEPGSQSKPGYVGWTGLPPIAVLFEDVFGIVPNAPANRLAWRVRLTGEHGVRRYPFGPAGVLDLKCRQRKSGLDRPSIEIRSNVPLTLDVVWEGGAETLNVPEEPC
jgi:hypothetical protein